MLQREHVQHVERCIVISVFPRPSHSCAISVATQFFHCMKHRSNCFILKGTGAETQEPKTRGRSVTPSRPRVTSPYLLPVSSVLHVQLKTDQKQKLQTENVHTLTALLNSFWLMITLPLPIRYIGRGAQQARRNTSHTTHRKTVKNS